MLIYVYINIHIYIIIYTYIQFCHIYICVCVCVSIWGALFQNVVKNVQKDAVPFQTFPSAKPIFCLHLVGLGLAESGPECGGFDIMHLDLFYLYSFVEWDEYLI